MTTASTNEYAPPPPSVVGVGGGGGGGFVREIGVVVRGDVDVGGDVWCWCL